MDEFVTLARSLITIGLALLLVMLRLEPEHDEQQREARGDQPLEGR